MTFVKNDSDGDVAELVAEWGHKHEFGDIWWLPGHGKVILRKDDRVDISTPADGLNLVFRPQSASNITHDRSEGPLSCQSMTPHAAFNFFLTELGQ